MMEEHHKYEKLKCMIAIADRGHGDKVVNLLKKNHNPYHFICLGRGTASSDIMDYIGIGESEKDIVFSFLPERIAYHVLHEVIDKDLKFHRAGHGIAFTIPISCINRLVANKCTEFSESNRSVITGGEKMEQMNQYELIITILAQGYSDEAMEAAKAAGARGGTVLHARGLGGEEAAKFLGITIQPEKELLLILANKEKKAAIMEEISKAAGICTKGRGICFSVPVDDTIGLESELFQYGKEASI